MTRAIVIKRYGDPALSGAIADGMTKVIEMDVASIAAVRAECERLKALNDIRRYADGIRLDAECKALATKYPPEHHGRLYGAVLGAWGLLWTVIFEVYDYLSEWNRRG